MKGAIQILLAGLILLPGLGMGQSSDRTPSGAQAFTLEQCIEYALRNSLEIQNAVIDEQIATAKVRETRGIGLPQIDGSVGLQHNQKLPRMFAQYISPEQDFFGLQNVPGIQQGDVAAIQNFFQLKSAGNASLNVTQILFNGSYLVGLQAANTYRELASKTSLHTREDAVELVTKAFYNVLLNKDRMELFDANITRLDSLLHTTKAMFENGFAESIDVDRLQVAYNNLTIERDNFYNIQEVGIQLLKFQMNYPIAEPIEIVGDIASLTVDENLLMNYNLNWDYSMRSDYRVLEMSKKLSALDLKNKYAEGMPSLVAFANLGYSTQSPNVGGLFKTESSIPEMEMIGPDKWYPFSSFGVSLNIPIFSGLQRTYRVQQARLSLNRNENSLRNLRAAIDLQMKTTSLTYQSAMNTLRAQAENKRLADNVARVTKIKWEEGVGSNLEVLDAENSLKQAQLNYYNALFTVLSAKVELDRAFGKINTVVAEPTTK